MDSSPNYQICFDIQYIKVMQSSLEAFFDFTPDQILTELVDVIFKWRSKASPDEIAKIEGQCTLDDGGIDGLKYGFLLGGEIGITVPREFTQEDFDATCMQYLRPLLKDKYQLYRWPLVFITALYFRDHNPNYEDPSSYDDVVCWLYKLHIRPDLLKLYIALNGKKERGSERITIKIGNNSPINLSNQTRWFELLFKNIFDKYLSIESVKEAKAELDFVYGKKIGNKGNITQLKYIYGIYKLMEGSAVQPKTQKTASMKICKFIVKYLAFIGEIKFDESINKETQTEDLQRQEYEKARQIRSIINNIKDSTLENILDRRKYKLPKDTNFLESWLFKYW
ncbi:MAG: hypothetical protein GX416_10490 [Bacteroidales bacterium]|nr:hypothetical protein [Bacteroidales bacterium]